MLVPELEKTVDNKLSSSNFLASSGLLSPNLVYSRSSDLVNDTDDAK